jgi:hypothetical protein
VADTVVTIAANQAQWLENLRVEVPLISTPGYWDALAENIADWARLAPSSRFWSKAGILLKKWCDEYDEEKGADLLPSDLELSYFSYHVLCSIISLMLCLGGLFTWLITMNPLGSFGTWPTILVFSWAILWGFFSAKHFLHVALAYEIYPLLEEYFMTEDEPEKEEKEDEDPKLGS